MLTESSTSSMKLSAEDLWLRLLTRDQVAEQHDEEAEYAAATQSHEMYHLEAVQQTRVKVP